MRILERLSCCAVVKVFLAGTLAVSSSVRAADLESTPHLVIETGHHGAAVTDVCFASNSHTFYTASADKTVREWRLVSAQDGSGQVAWRSGRVFRWPIGRGNRGVVYAVAVSPNSQLLAMAGYSERAYNGDIYVYDLRSGEVQFALEGLRESINDVSFSADSRWVAAVDETGAVGRWQLPVDGARSLMQGVESGGYAKAAARYSVAFTGDQLIYPTPSTAEIWTLQSTQPGFRAPLHQRRVNDIATSPDGLTMVSAHAGKYAYIYLQPRTENKFYRLPERAQEITRVAFLTNKQFATFSQGEIAIWNVDTYQVEKAIPVTTSVVSMAGSRDGRFLAYADDRGELYLLSVASGHLVKMPNRPGVRQIAPSETNYDVSIDTSDINLRFSPESSEVRQDSVSSSSSADKIRVTQRGSQLEIRTRTTNQLLGRAPFDDTWYGPISTYALLEDDQRNATWFVIGTRLQNSILAYRRSGGDGDFVPSRHFRGHHDVVTALGQSFDSRYLVSGSADGTVRYWSLEQPDDNDATARLWGCTFVDRQGQVVIDKVDPHGPIYHKGLRSGDVVTRLVWGRGDGGNESREGRAVLDALRQAELSRQYAFFIRRDANDLTPFYLRPAWFPTLSVYSENESAWIAWTPNGQYDYGPAGERLIRWQFNNDFASLPSIFPASQFHSEFYQPKVIQQLLRGIAKEDTQTIQAIESRVVEHRPPDVRIINPVWESTAEPLKVDQAELVVVGETKVGRTARPELSLLVNGSPIDEETISSKGIVRLASETWRVTLRAGVHELQVRATLPNGVFNDSEVLRVEYRPENQKPVLHLLSIGVSAFADETLRLDYADRDAEDFVGALKQSMGPLYEGGFNAKVLVNEQATRTSILAELDTLVDQVELGDTVVLFVSSHGEFVEKDDEFYVLPHDVDPENLAATGISEKSIAQTYRKLGGRGKLMLAIDTCFSGAVLPERLTKDLGGSDYGVYVITSSAKDERSYEISQLRHGAFAYGMLEALGGKAIDVGNNGVSFEEFAVSVKDIVREVLPLKANELKGKGAGQVLRQTPQYSWPYDERSFRLVVIPPKLQLAGN